MTMHGRYGSSPATFRFEGDRDSLSVTLERDPGAGSMFYTRISPQVVTVEAGDVDDIRRTARILADGVRWITPAGAGLATIARLRAESTRLAQLADTLELERA